MKEASENGKELSYSAHVNGMNERMKPQKYNNDNGFSEIINTVTLYLVCASFCCDQCNVLMCR